MVLGSGGMSVKTKGFTLLELLITLAVIAILGMIALTSYSDYTKRANRVEAKTALTRIAQEEERYYSVHHHYLFGEGALEQFNKGDKPDKTERELYKLNVKENGTGYIITAEAVENGAQWGDDDCRKFTLDHTGKETAISSSGSDETMRCWSR